ncbi:hypothetical protein MCOR27_010605 [Pyricularia oryzae]|nr:hypothetical protein MCOR27_010605 [Pyricularia oryzae]
MLFGRVSEMRREERRKVQLPGAMEQTFLQSLGCSSIDKEVGTHIGTQGVCPRSGRLAQAQPNSAAQTTSRKLGAGFTNTSQTRHHRLESVVSPSFGFSDPGITAQQKAPHLD